MKSIFNIKIIPIYFYSTLDNGLMTLYVLDLKNICPCFKSSCYLGTFNHIRESFSKIQAYRVLSGHPYFFSYLDELIPNFVPGKDGVCFNLCKTLNSYNKVNLVS